MFLEFLFTVIFSYLVTLYLVPIFCSLANKLHFVDVPDGKIKKHTSAVPYLGGVALYFGFLCGLILTIPFENKISLFLVGITFLLFVGLIDDLLVLKPYQKFFGQIIAALCFLKSGLFLKETFLFHNFWRIPVSFLWVLSIINAFNLVDVMDGLATSIAICATVSFLIMGFIFKIRIIVILLGSLLGGLCAFLWYNKPEARIYLGDAGALFIGGVLATVPFLFKWGIYTEYGYLTPVIILSIPLLEISSLVFIRLYKGVPFYCATPDHFSLYLLKNGWSKWAILYYIVGLSTILCIVSIMFVFNIISLICTIGIGIVFLFIWILSISGLFLNKKS